MYEQFYGFSTLPFAARPAAGEYYFSEHQRRVLEDLEARVGQGDCVCVLSGSEGVGKTTLVQSLCEAVKDRVSTFTIDAAQTTGEMSLAQKIITALGMEADCSEPASLDECLASQLLKLSDSDRKSMLIISNADVLTASDIQMLGTLAPNPSLQMLLVANLPEPGSESDQADYAELADHITERWTLLPLSSAETETYIRVRLIQAGASPELFTPSASEAVYHYSNGLPRLINRICDLALVYGYSRQSKQIDKQTMDFVLSDRWGGGQQQAADTDEPSTSPSSAPEPAEPSAAESVSVNATTSRSEAVVDAVVDSEPLQQVQNQRTGADHSGQAGTSSQADSVIAEQLVELLRQGEQRETNTDQPSDRDIYDFIRLSMKYHQRHLERFTFGVVAGVALLATAGVWGFIAWQNGAFLSAERVPDQANGDTSPASTVTWEAPAPAQEVVISEPAPTVKMRASVARVLPSPEPEITMPHEEIPSAEQAALESPAKTEKTIPDPAAIAEQAALTASIEAENRALQAELSASIEAKDRALQAAELTASIEAKNRALRAEQDKLVRERRRLQKKLANQRAENERLKHESQREHERALKALSQVKEARKSVHLSWDKQNTSTPDAFPEE